MQTITNDSNIPEVTDSLVFRSSSQWFQKFLDDIKPFPTLRWIVAVVLFYFYILKVNKLQGFYLVSYALGLYHLHLFVEFLSPKNDPAESVVPDEPADGEFITFIRYLPEFQFWYRVVISTLLSIFISSFKIFDFQLSGPILSLYFVAIWSYMMTSQIIHMIKYQYLPFSRRKPRYHNRDERENANEAD